jgi:hypothetical protein
MTKTYIPSKAISSSDVKDKLSTRAVILDAALAYAARGWAVFPCKNKKPLVKWREESTTDPNQIQRWWKSRPGAAIGVDCGKSGLVVIDCDVKNGIDGIKNWENLHYETSGCLVSRTPSGGLHYIYADTFGGKIRNSAGKLAPGVDVRANGGYVIVPPSQIDGKSYE